MNGVYGHMKTDDSTTIKTWSRGSSGVKIVVSVGNTVLDKLQYQISLGAGEPWLDSAPVSVFANSAWYSSSSASGDSAKALVLVGDAEEWTDTDSRIGLFDAFTVTWRWGEDADGSLFNTPFKYFTQYGAIAFEQTFVDGIALGW